VIDDQANRDRRIFVPKEVDGLGAAVFEDFEILLAKLRNRVAFTVAHSCLLYQRDDYHRDAEVLLIAAVAGRHDLGGSKSAKDEKKDREHSRFRDAVLSV